MSETEIGGGDFFTDDSGSGSGSGAGGASDEHDDGSGYGLGTGHGNGADHSGFGHGGGDLRSGDVHGTGTGTERRAGGAEEVMPVTSILVIDVQRDFCSGGALAVPAGDSVVPVLNRLLGAAVGRQMTIYASRDWHPVSTQHFVTGGGVWPVHCVADSDGARFHADLELPADAVVISKGVEPNADGFSAFEGHADDGTTLEERLRAAGVAHLYIGGLATDYCVRHSVLDALRRGLQVTLLTDAVAAVDMSPGDGARALQEMREAGAVLKTLSRAD